MLQTEQQAVLDGFRHVFFHGADGNTEFVRNLAVCQTIQLRKQKRFTCFAV
ncbi:Uncharacterised protein [Escherichia coli]|nr:Uncharacterised protein [Escherichia coli]